MCVITHKGEKQLQQKALFVLNPRLQKIIICGFLHPHAILMLALCRTYMPYVIVQVRMCVTFFPQKVKRSKVVKLHQKGEHSFFCTTIKKNTT